MQQTASNPPLAAAASTASVQQVQTPIKFDVSVLFEGNSMYGHIFSKSKKCNKLVDLESKSCIPSQSVWLLG